MNTTDTGMVRRIDDLGRVVIPKDFRKALDIFEGDPLKIFLDAENKQIIIQRCEGQEYEENR